MQSSNYIGQRLSYDGNLCVVRYVGEVRGTKGKWLGVEWDDPTRGKHAGEHGGVRYFECTPISRLFRTRLPCLFANLVNHRQASDEKANRAHSSVRIDMQINQENS